MTVITAPESVRETVAPKELNHFNQLRAATITAQADGLTLDGEPVDVDVHTIAWDPVSAAKGEFKHFMQKEIYEHG